MKVSFPEIKNNVTYSYNKSESKKYNYSPSFQAKGKLDPDVVKEIAKNSKFMGKFLAYAGEHQGEALNILVTAFGTAVICPMFIRFNPFSKEDKQTRAYSAWRQPISAVLAVVTQLSITKYFNNWFAKKGADGVFNRADLSAAPPDSHVKRIVKLQNPDYKAVVKKEHPEYTRKQVREEAKRRFEEDVKKYKTDCEKKVVARQRALLKDKPVEWEELISQNALNETKEKIFDGYKVKYEKEIKEHFGKDVDSIKNKTLEKFFENKLIEEAKVQYADKIAGGMSAKEAANLFVKEKTLYTIKGNVVSETIVKLFIRENKNNIARKSIDEVIAACNKESILEYIQKLHDAKEIKDSTNIHAEEIADSIIKRLKNIKDWETTSSLGEYTSVKDLGKDYKEVLHNVKIKRMVQAKSADAKIVFKTMNTQVGLVVTLLTLPITCGILNWAYPRIMEKIMPEMAAKKKQDQAQSQKVGGDK